MRELPLMGLVLLLSLAGTVALWDLHTTSSLLQSSTPEDGMILYPIQVYSLCDAMIRSFAWCPLGRLQSSTPEGGIISQQQETSRMRIRTIT